MDFRYVFIADNSSPAQSMRLSLPLIDGSGIETVDRLRSAVVTELGVKGSVEEREAFKSRAKEQDLHLAGKLADAKVGLPARQRAEKLKEDLAETRAHLVDAKATLGDADDNIREALRGHFIGPVKIKPVEAGEKAKRQARELVAALEERETVLVELLAEAEALAVGEEKAAVARRNAELQGELRAKSAAHHAPIQQAMDENLEGLLLAKSGIEFLRSQK